ncbi:MAG: FAD binding domain-containing protein [Gaiellales bacterium]
MGLPAFELHSPTSIAEATALLDRHGDEAVVYSGGTELLLLMKLGFAEPRHLVDVKRIDELRTLEASEDALTIGGAVTHREIEQSQTVRDRWPALAEMERGVANIRVRNAGTLGGNLCFSDPHSDPLTFLLAADAEVVLGRGPARRTVPVADFVRGPYTTALQAGEILVAVRVPALPPGAAVVHRKLAFRERPAVTVAAFACVRADQIVEARIAVGSVGPVPVLVAEAGRALVGRPGADEIEAAGALAASGSGATSNANGSAEYKRNLVRVLVGRAFRAAADRSG